MRGRPPLAVEGWSTIRKFTKNDQPTAVAYYRDSTGKRRVMQRTGKTEAAAGRALEAALREATSSRSDLVTEQATVETVALTWLGQMEASDRAINTKNVYRNIVKNTIIVGLGSIRLRELTASRVHRFIDGLRTDRGYSVALDTRKVLRQILAVAVSLDAIPSNYASSATLPRVKAATVKVYPLEHLRGLRARFAEFESTSARPTMPRLRELEDFATMLLATGARPGELLALRWPELELASDKPTVFIAATVTLDAESKVIRQPHTKSVSGMRVLTLSREAADMLIARRVHSQSEYVFPAGNGGLKYPANLRKKWRAAIAGTEFEGIVPKDFRKAVATAIEREFGSEAARLQLGHFDDAVTRKHYILREMRAPDVTAALE